MNKSESIKNYTKAVSQQLLEIEFVLFSVDYNSLRTHSVFMVMVSRKSEGEEISIVDICRYKSGTVHIWTPFLCLENSLPYMTQILDIEASSRNELKMSALWQLEHRHIA